MQDGVGASLAKKQKNVMGTVNSSAFTFYSSLFFRNFAVEKKNQNTNIVNRKL